MTHVLGMRYEHLEQLKQALANYGIENGYQLWYAKNDWRSLLVYRGRILLGLLDVVGDWLPDVEHRKLLKSARRRREPNVQYASTKGGGKGSRGVESSGRGGMGAESGGRGGMG
ncbi:hypothetical protein Tco_1324621 [Tanacetum coccineum]